ncbi:MAG: zinc-ribbon and FHA domain-containing protein [Actinobacteria bacterium]|nr:zinc-ribbon and FHA domain-containing protein [Actinomycetota bacterium]
MPAVYCNKCGHQNPEGANFCSSCGHVLELSASAGEETTLTFVPDDARSETQEEEFPDISDLARGDALLLVKRGPNAGARFLLDQDRVRAGRHPESEIFLDDITVSRRHVEFSRSDGAWKIKDAGSLNGTYLNRERVEESDLKSGDEVQIGKFKLIFLSGSGE